MGGKRVNSGRSSPGRKWRSAARIGSGKERDGKRWVSAAAFKTSIGCLGRLLQCLHYLETAELLDGVEIFIIVQKGDIMFDGHGCDHAVDRFWVRIARIRVGKTPRKPKAPGGIPFLPHMFYYTVFRMKRMILTKLSDLPLTRGIRRRSFDLFKHFNRKMILQSADFHLIHPLEKLENAAVVLFAFPPCDE